MSFIDQLNSTVAIWESGSVDDEWMFQKLREDVVGQLSPCEAFEEIPCVLAMLRDHRGESVATELIETVLALAAQSQTTEVPRGFREAVPHLRNQFRQYGEYSRDKLEEAIRFYRI